VIKGSTSDSFIAKANLAFELACRKIIDRARISNSEIVIWKDGKIVQLTPDEATRELEANLSRINSSIEAD
jgi:hypothetical protein